MKQRSMVNKFSNLPELYFRNGTNMLNGENTALHCKLFTQLDKQIDDFEQRNDNDGIRHDIKLLVQ